MTEHEADLIAQKFAEKLQQARSVSDTEHWNHHRWIAAQIAREEAWTKVLEQVKLHLIKWGMIGVVSFLFYGAWLAAKEGLIR